MKPFQKSLSNDLINRYYARYTMFILYKHVPINIWPRNNSSTSIYTANMRLSPTSHCDNGLTTFFFFENLVPTKHAKLVIPLRVCVSNIYNKKCSLKNPSITIIVWASSKLLFLPVMVAVTGNFSFIENEWCKWTYTQAPFDRLYPISEEDDMPKALLPVGNKPVISYTLEWLEKAGIHGKVRWMISTTKIPLPRSEI